MTIKSKGWCLLSGFCVAAGLIICCPAATGSPETHPEFDEVSGLIRSNLVGATAGQVDWLAVQGLLQELSPRVVLVDNPDESTAHGSPQTNILKSEVLRGSIGYIQYGTINTGADDETHELYLTLGASNQLSGVVLDLRGATGDDYASALGVADLFLAYEAPLLNWGDGLKSSHPKDDAISIPVAVLVDGETGGSAEALAAILRQSGVALIIGSRTSGTAGIKRGFPLKNGQILDITVSNIQLGDAQMISNEGLNPDVEVKESDIAAAQDSSSAASSVKGGSDTNSSNGPARARLDEANLVRRWRGEMLSAEDFERPPVTVAPEEQDAVLVRALDLMDGLAILRSWQK